MKRLLVISAVLLITGSAIAQQPARRLRYGTSTPSSCTNTGEVFINTATPALLRCINGKFQPDSVGGVNAQTGTSYTLVYGDKNKLLTSNNAASVAWTLPQATGDFKNGWSVFVYNLGAGTVTVTPTTSTVNGGATLAFAQGEGGLIFSDGTSYSALKTNASGAPSGSAGGDLAGTYPNPTVSQARGIRETSGPTTLTFGTVTDGEYLRRSGSTIVSGVPSGGSPGASDTFFQYNNAGSFAGTSMFTKSASNRITFDGGANANSFEVKSNSGSVFWNFDNSGLGVHSGADYGSNWGRVTAGDYYAKSSYRASAVGAQSGVGNEGLIYFRETLKKYFVNEDNGNERFLMPLVARVSTQFDKTNTTLANVTGLSVPLADGYIYRFRAVLFVDADSTGGHKYAINVSGINAPIIIYQIDSIDNSTNSFVINSRQTVRGGSAGQAGPTIIKTIIEGTASVVPSDSAGNLTVQFAQNAASGTSSILVNSTLEAVQVP